MGFIVVFGRFWLCLLFVWVIGVWFYVFCVLFGGFCFVIFWAWCTLVLVVLLVSFFF